MGPIIIGLGVLFFILSKKFIIQPRLGFVKFGHKRKTRKLRTVLVLVLNMIILFILFLFNLTGLGTGSNFPAEIQYLIEGLLFITLPLCFVAYFLQYPRLYLSALIMGLGFFLADLSSILIPLPFNFLFTYLAIGLCIITIGFVYFVRFLIKNPKSEKRLVQNG